MRRVDLPGIEGVRFVPDDPLDVAILVLAGSSGRVDVARAELLAGHRTITESVRWFGGPGQHSGPWEIPIEFFIQRVESQRQVCK